MKKKDAVSAIIGTILGLSISIPFLIMIGDTFRFIIFCGLPAALVGYTLFVFGLTLFFNRRSAKAQKGVPAQ